MRACATPGTNVSFDVQIGLPNGTDATNVVLTDNVPLQTTFVSAVQTGGADVFTCTTPAVGASTGTINCSTPTLRFGAAPFPATFVFTFHVSSLATGAITNTANVSATGDTNPLNNSATDSAAVVFSADVSVIKTGPATVSAGNNITYTITVANLGPGAAYNNNLQDLLPFGVEFLSFTHTAGPSWTCTTPPPGAIGGVIDCTISTFPAGTSSTFRILMHVPPEYPAGLSAINNQATVTNPGDPNPANNNSALVSTDVTHDSDVEVTKTGPLTATAGQPITYIITATNNGPSRTSSFTLQDTLPAQLTFESWTQLSGPTLGCLVPAVGMGGTILCGGTEILPGVTVVFRLIARVVATTAPGTSVSNTATVSVSGAMASDPDPFNNGSTSTATVNTQADLTVTKIAGAATVTPGNNITYTVTISNNGPSTAQTVSLTDVVPTGTTFVSAIQNFGPPFVLSTPAVGATGTISATIASLGPANPAQFSFVVRVNTSATPGMNISNTATGSTATSDPTLGNNSSTASTTVLGPDLAVTKSDSPDPAQAGNNITYAITVMNNGSAGANNVTLSDVTPANTTFVSNMQTAGPGFSCTTPAVGAAGTVTCNTAFFAAGASATFSLVVRINPTTIAGTTITNTATASTTDTEPNNSNNSATATTGIASSADVSVTKSGPGTLTPGADAVYTVTVTNSGPDAAASVSLNDAVPAGMTFVSATQSSGPAFSCTTPVVGGTGTVTCNLASLASGASAAFTITFRVNPTASGTITNTASVTSAATDPTPGNNSASSSGTVASAPDLVMSKSDSPDPVSPGSDITYAITVMNTGTAVAANVALTDTIPANTTFVSFTAPAGWSASTPPVGGTGTVSANNAALAASTTASFTLVVRVDAGASGGTVITNTAAASTTSAETTTANNTATTSTTVAAAGLADLSVSKNAPASASPGSNITYTITLTNGGGAAAANVTLADTLPASTTFVSFTQTAGPAFSCTTPGVGAIGTVNCSLASFASASTATFSLVVQLSGSASGTVTNSATAATTSAESTGANNTGSASTTVSAVPPPTTADVSITKTTPSSAAVSSAIVYTIVVTNNGPGAAANVTVTDALQAGTTFVSATPTQGSCTGTTTVTCTLGTLASGASASIVLTVTAPASAGSVSNTATVSSTTTDPNGGNNSSTVTVTVVALVPLLDPRVLLLLAVALAAGGAMVMRS